jgi:pantothenate kinase
MSRARLPQRTPVDNRRLLCYVLLVNGSSAGADDRLIPTLLDPIGRIRNLAATTRRRYVIGLSGVPGAGKTTVAARWTKAVESSVGPDVFVVLGMDGFHLSKAELRALPDPDEAFARRGAPWTFNPTAIATQLRALHEGFERHVVEWPGFEHGVGDPVEAAFTVPPEVPVILVEGIYTACVEDGWDAVRNEFDEQWYLDVPWDDAAPRLIARHAAAWNMSEHDATRRADSNDRINAQLVLQGRIHADWLVYPSVE